MCFQERPWHTNILALWFSLQVVSILCLLSSVLGSSFVSRCGSLECHLCSSNCASPKTAMAVSFSLNILSFVSSRVMTLSSYRLFLSPSTSLWDLSFTLSRCCCSVPPNKNSDCTRPNNAQINLNTSTFDTSLFFIQWNLKAS